MVSRKEACKIAKEDALAHRLGFAIRQVARLDELAFCAPNVYLAASALENCWIAYVDDPSPPGLVSSTVVVIDRETGAVVYRGSANDEG